MDSFFVILCLVTTFLCCKYQYIHSSTTKPLSIERLVKYRSIDYTGVTRNPLLAVYYTLEWTS